MITTYVRVIRTNGFGCDLCRTVDKSTNTYETHSPVDLTEGNLVQHKWTTTEWEICALCSPLVDSGNATAIKARIGRLRDDITAYEAASLVDSLLNKLPLELAKMDCNHPYHRSEPYRSWRHLFRTRWRAVCQTCGVKVDK